MNEEVIRILKEYDNLILEITEMSIKVRVNDSPFRDATDTDKLEFIREEWFKISSKLSDLGYEVYVK